MRPGHALPVLGGRGAMSVLLDAVRARSPCALRLVQAYSTSLKPIISRVPVRNRRIQSLREAMRQDADHANGSGGNESGPGTDEAAKDRRSGRQRPGTAKLRRLAAQGTGPMGPLGRGRDPEKQRKYAGFARLVDSRFTLLVEGLGPWAADKAAYVAFGLHSEAEVGNEVRLFRARLAECERLANTAGRVDRASNPLFWQLRNAFVAGDVASLSRELRYAFQSHVLGARLPRGLVALQTAVADLRFPAEWYPATRTMQRTVHLHVGPTNSGKTYRALQALERARTGIYAGPLRLLAHEIYARFLAKGKPCALITGEEQRFPRGEGQEGGDGTTTATTAAATATTTATDAYFQSCTVEMTPLNKRVDVAVIDEIQMMADPERGWAWTQAFLGVQAREVHLCGEERAVDLIRELCARNGDRCVVHRYRRLSGLEVLGRSLDGNLLNLRKGDAVISFSRVNLHSLKAGIEKQTGRRCAIVYGSLPPETRAQQAALFNDPHNDYDFLVASDAIGMGLNLDIRRVVFETATKHDGFGLRHLTVPEIKQIGGRAGRFRTAAQAVQAGRGDGAENGAEKGPEKTDSAGDNAHTSLGHVVTLEDEDLRVVNRAFESVAPPIEAAGIQPPTFAIERFAQFFPPQTPFSFVLRRLRELVRVSRHFRLCTPKESLDVADIIQPYALTVADRCVFIAAPVALRDPGQREVLAAYARCVAEMRGGDLLDIAEVDLEVLDTTRHEHAQGPAAYLRRLEALHKAITLYLWLSYRYVGVFRSQPLAFHVKALVEAKITEYLENLTFVPEARQKRAQTMRTIAEKQEKKKQRRRAQVDAEVTGEAEVVGEAEAAEQTGQKGHKGQKGRPGGDVFGRLSPPLDEQVARPASEAR